MSGAPALLAFRKNQFAVDGSKTPTVLLPLPSQSHINGMKPGPPNTNELVGGPVVREVRSSQRSLLLLKTAGFAAGWGVLVAVAVGVALAVLALVAVGVLVRVAVGVALAVLVLVSV